MWMSWRAYYYPPLEPKKTSDQRCDWIEAKNKPKTMDLHVNPSKNKFEISLLKNRPSFLHNKTGIRTFES